MLNSIELAAYHAERWGYDLEIDGSTMTARMYESATGRFMGTMPLV